MGRNEDILFCKIAITTGLVSQEDAQKCLALCDRREKEGGRRPAIGPLMAKHNLLSQEDVKRLTDAVNKRLGRTAPPLRTARGSGTATGRGKGRSRSRSRRGAAREAAPSRPVDPRTLWMGIGTGLVFVGVILTIVFLYISSTAGDRAARESGSARSGASPRAPAGQRSTSPSGAGVVPVDETPAAPSAAQRLAAAAQAPIDPEFQKAHATAIQKARLIAYTDGLKDQAISYLESFLKEHDVEYTASGGKLREEADATLRELRGEEETTASDSGIGLEP